MTREEAAKIFQEKALDPYYVLRRRELYQMAANALSEPEIVKCKDCIHGIDTDESYICRYKNGFSEHNGEHFCGYGKRR